MVQSKRYGCYNRKDYRPGIDIVKHAGFSTTDGHVFRMTATCQYDRYKTDPQCQGCSQHKEKLTF